MDKTFFGRDRNVIEPGWREQTARNSSLLLILKMSSSICYSQVFDLTFNFKYSLRHQSEDTLIPLSFKVINQQFYY
jgi:hypothetical protein